MHRKTDWSENRKDDKGEMSFSGMVKEELSRQIGLARHCKMAELAAILCSCGKMECFSGDSKLKIQTENEAVARKCFTLLQKTFNIETKIFVRENSHLKRVKVYTIEITDPEEIQVIFSGTAACHEQYRPGYACIVGYAGGTAELLQTGVYQGSFFSIRFNQ